MKRTFKNSKTFRKSKKNKTHKKLRGGVRLSFFTSRRKYYTPPEKTKEEMADTCPLCLDPLVGTRENPLIQLKCGHIFHKNDLDLMNHVCPMDQQKFKKIKTLNKGEYKAIGTNFNVLSK